MKSFFNMVHLFSARILLFVLICTFASSESQLEREKGQSHQVTPKIIIKVYEKIASLNKRLDKLETNSTMENEALNADEIKKNNSKIINVLENVFKKLDRFESYFEKNIKIEKLLLDLIEKSDQKCNTSANEMVREVASQCASLCETKVSPWKNETSEKIKGNFEQLELCLKKDQKKSCNACDSNPCLNGGLCEIISNGCTYRCTQCPSFTNGKNCENVKCDESNKCFRLDNALYFGYETAVQWEQAKQTCASKGMTMAMPKDNFTSEFIQKQLEAIFGADSPFFWIGLKNNVEAEKWQWADGSELGDYTGGSYSFNPDNKPLCAAVFVNYESLVWGTTYCTSHYYPLCEKQLSIH